MLSYPCLDRTEKILGLLSHRSYPSRENIRIIVNRHVNNSSISISEAERFLQQDVFWTFPNSFTATMTALNQGKTLSQAAPRSPMTISIKRLAAVLASEINYATA